MITKQQLQYRKFLGINLSSLVAEMKIVEDDGGEEFSGRRQFRLGPFLPACAGVHLPVEQKEMEYEQ